MSSRTRSIGPKRIAKYHNALLELYATLARTQNLTQKLWMAERNLDNDFFRSLFHLKIVLKVEKSTAIKWIGQFPDTTMANSVVSFLENKDKEHCKLKKLTSDDYFSHQDKLKALDEKIERIERIMLCLCNAWDIKTN